ncbi:hypothetical protein PHLCEN_2v7503 [Hermanssonia centrifuga]|uniref:Uncharacterized protein n=1 Tax=Hermanssonia centrifuga TaxID=98765 RepID=A0A2R6NW95_9APHY|nr:hypothetical protein PHLCEN_2v7503 [Hermanssonia centrifuga]
MSEDRTVPYITVVVGGGGEERTSARSAIEARYQNAVAGSSTAGASSMVEAEPLPSKRGEIGYQEPEEEESVDGHSLNGASDSALPARHPADREPIQSSSSSSLPLNGRATPSSTHSGNSMKKSFICRLKPPNVTLFGGVRLSTLLLLILHICVLIGTIVGWVLVATHMSALIGNTNNAAFGASSSQIFVHVAFGIAVLMQLIFLERRVFRVRAERYCHAHPGLPFHSRRERQAGLAMGIAPWNRPPLPTYAAALAQSGVGTGDVEDNEIAVVPPPAYGHTRGSTLLLSGFVSDTLRAQRRERARNGGDARSSTVRSSWMSGRSDRPVSYASLDEEWEERSDRIRAVRLEETLARLEEARIAPGDGELRR